MPRFPAGTAAWTVVHSTGSAADLHHRPLPQPVAATVWIHDVTGPALVMGSTQPESVIDAARANADGVEVCRRASGGGIVALEPGRQCWVDVVLPAPRSRDDPLWSDDVGRAFTWVGEAWARALRSLLAGSSAGVEVHSGPALEREAGKVVCFAGIGSGEVVVDGRKVVGLSQRRTRDAARFQCACVLHWNPDLLTRYVDPGALAAVDVDPASLAVGWPAGLAPPPVEAVVAAFVDELPSPG